MDSMNLKTTISNLELRTLIEADAPSLFALSDANRAYLRTWLPWLDATQSSEDSLGFIRFTQSQTAAGGGYTFGIWQDDTLVGVCDLRMGNKAARSASIGYWVAHKSAGRGYARAATQALLAYAFTDLGLHRIEIRAASENIASQKVALSCGLRYEGTARECEWLYDHFVDHKIYAILSSDVR
jgi:ribosomal-protein-serine acetyltransferase